MEDEGVILQVLRFRIGLFKGKRAMMARMYGYPKRRTEYQGFYRFMGEGQYADYKAPLTNARRGYATLSIAWAGRISAPQYQFLHIVKLFWNGK